MRTAGLVSLGVLVAIGCSSDVDTVDGTGGAGGAGVTSAVVTTGASNSVTTGASTTAGSTAVSSSSTGGGNTCEQGCAHIASCGFDACAMGGVDCSSPQYECPMGCVLDASCADLLASLQGNPPPPLAACLMTCQGGQGGGGTGGGEQGCQECIFQSDCATPCISDNACLNGWGACAQGCSDPACFDACDAMHPESATIYAQVYACSCMACDTACGAVMDPCNQGAGGGI